MYTAYYLPALNGQDDPSSSGFDTEDLAWEYVFSRMCKSCKEERALALENKTITIDGEEWEYLLYPACASEWIVGLTDEIDKAEDFRDILIAGGFKQVPKNQL